MQQECTTVCSTLAVLLSVYLLNLYQQQMGVAPTVLLVPDRMEPSQGILLTLWGCWELAQHLPPFQPQQQAAVRGAHRLSRGALVSDGC